MDDNKIILSGVCPYCPAVLDYEEDAHAVVCHSCGNAVPTRILRPLNFAKLEREENDNDKKTADGVTSPTTGVIYFDNYCDSYNWAQFIQNCELTVPMLTALSDACKIKFSADPITYYLDFRCIAVPVMKKIEGLEVLEVEIINNFQCDDSSDLFEYFDKYACITKTLSKKKDDILKALAADIVLAKRFGADAVLVADLENTLALIENKINSVNVVRRLEDIPGYNTAKEIKDAELAAKIRKQGIDAEKTYKMALELAKIGNIDNALHLLCAIHGYKDTDKLIEDYTRIFKFNDELVEIAGKYYMVRKTPGFFDVTNPRSYTCDTLSLYEIVNTVPSGYPALTNISDIVHSFGSKIFFLRDGVQLCCFDTACESGNAVVVLDEAPAGDYVTDHHTPIYYSADKTKFFIRKKLRDNSAKKGCFGRKKKKKDAINRFNNYSVVLVDMDNVTCETILPEVVDVMDYYNDKIFYTTAVTTNLERPVFRVYDLKTGKSSDILGAECVIHNVHQGKAIFSLWAPSKYNMDMYTIDFEDKTPKLIDENIMDYYTTFGDRVFYTVGTSDYCRLYSAAMDGSDRIEIMENPGRVCTINSGWLYYINGEGANACLMKVSVDGKKNLLVASRFEKLIKMNNERVYYLATNGDLKVVRTDGADDKRIAANVADNKIIIDDENVYYLKRDYLGVRDGDEEGYGFSLYTTDLAGKNLHKLAHDVKNIEEYNDRYIYICKKRGIRYAIHEPIDKRSENSTIVTHILTYYEAYDKKTCEFKEILHLGEPQKKTITYKKYFWPFTKRITEQSRIDELETNYSHSRNDVAPMGAIKREEDELDERVREGIRNEKLAIIEAKKAAKQAKKDAKKAKKEAKAEKKADKKARKEAKQEAKAAKKEAKADKKNKGDEPEIPANTPDTAENDANGGEE